MSDVEDGDANYDDFMMSGDEDVDIVEMEDETDEEDGFYKDKEPTGINDQQAIIDNAEAFDEQALQELCETALSFLEDQDFKRSRDLLREINSRIKNHTTESVAIVWQWKSSLLIARSWLSEIHYNGIDDETYSGTGHAFLALVGLLDQNEVLDNDEVVKTSLTDLIQELFPSSERDFLFAVELIADDSLAWKMQLRLHCIGLMQASHRVASAAWAEELRRTLELKKIMAKVWSDRLERGCVDLRDIEGIRESCCETGIEDALGDKEYTDKIGLVLQCHIYNYLSGCADLPRELFAILIEKLGHFSSNSLSISQHLGLMIQLNTARALFMLSGHGMDETRVELPAFYKNVKELRQQFWSCLQHLEEIGGSRQNFSSLFECFILSGFIFCSMILRRSLHNEINPFDLEQIKIALQTPNVQLLRTVYHHFLQLDLRALYGAIQRLSGVKELLKGLINDIYYLAQLSKLWEQIAPVYSCISLKDIQDLLEIDSTIKVSRDNLLTVLMTSILNDTAKVYYKLDLTQDLVYFGDEYRVQLCSHPKQSFVKKTVQTPSGVKLSYLEVANNIGLFNEPCSLKGLDPCAFFDKIQRSRDHIQDQDCQSNSNPHLSSVKYTDKYEELAGLAREVLTFDHMKR